MCLFLPIPPTGYRKNHGGVEQETCLGHCAWSRAMMRGTRRGMHLDPAALTTVIQKRVRHVGSADGCWSARPGRGRDGEGVRRKGAATPQVKPSAEATERPGLRTSDPDTWPGSTAPQSLWQGNPVMSQGIADRSTSFHLPLDLHFYQIVRCILMFWVFAFPFPFPFKSFNDKTSGVWCKLNFLNGVEMQIIPSKVIQILLRFLVLRCCR